MSRQGTILAATILSAFAIIVLLVSGIPGPAPRSVSQEKPTIQAQGEAILPLRPDSYVLGISVSGEADTATRAHAAARARVQSLSEKFREIGVRETVLVDTRLVPRGEGGFTARTVLEVKLGLDGLDAPDRVSGINGVSVLYARPYTSDLAAQRAEAMAKAIEDAKANAALAATSAGLKIKSIRSVSVVEVSYPAATGRGHSHAHEHASASSHRLRVVVSVTFDCQ